eukprot:5703467-Pyramimonas_sp.AAC.1
MAATPLLATVYAAEGCGQNSTRTRGIFKYLGVELNSPVVERLNRSSMDYPQLWPFSASANIWGAN